VPDYRTWTEPQLELHLRQRAAEERDAVEFRLEEESPGRYLAGFFSPGTPKCLDDPAGVALKSAAGNDRQRALADFAASLDAALAGDR
jgi:hypothetical protein